MSRSLTIFIVALITAIAAAAQPPLVWLEPRHDFGTIREEAGPAHCTFEAVNTGIQPVSVLDARANCGCTSPTYPKTPVMPGDTLRVVVAYDPSGRPGRFSKQVKVTTDAGTKTLAITGTVIGTPATLQSRFPVACGRILLSNDICLFGETAKGRVLAAAVNIYNPTADTITPVVVSKPGFINVMFSPATIPPGEQGTLSLTAYTDRTEGYGLLEDHLTLTPDASHPEAAADIRLMLTVNENFSKLTPKEREEAPHITFDDGNKTLDFGTIAADATASVVRTLRFTNTGRSPLLVRRIYATDPALEVKSSSARIKPGHSATITVTLSPDKIDSADRANHMLNSRITLLVNDPDHPSSILRAVGEIK